MKAILNIFNELTTKWWQPIVMGVSPVHQEVDFMDSMLIYLKIYKIIISDDFIFSIKYKI